MSYDPDRSDRPWSQFEIEEARSYRDVKTIIPLVGQTVWYRHNHHGDVTEALVTDVFLHDVNDLNCFSEDGELLRDPWPTVRLQTLHGLADTREARVRGSAGWLPHGWENA